MRDRSRTAERQSARPVDVVGLARSQAAAGAPPVTRRTGVSTVASTLGLTWCPRLYRDRPFQAAMLAGVGFWVGLWLCLPVHPVTPAQMLSAAFLSLVLWQPAIEECLFRGWLQGQLSRQSWGQRCWYGITAANACTALLFAAGHCWQHPPLWAVAVLLPGLMFGYCRDRYMSVYPGMVLHAFYNAGYFGLTGFP